MAQKTDPKQQDKKAYVAHADAGDQHAVLVNALRVVVTQDEGQWFAQGLELDYAAAGTTEEDVKTRFAQGLGATINEHLQIYGNIERVVKVAPQDAWNLWLIGDRHYTLDHVSIHHLQESAPAVQELPFSGIAFLGKPLTGAEAGAA